MIGPGEADGYELSMPLLGADSHGGPFDDDAYAAGWEMGALDTELARIRPPLLQLYIRSDNAVQADLIGMKHGYCVQLSPSEVEGWSRLRLTLAGGAS